MAKLSKKDIEILDKIDRRSWGEDYYAPRHNPLLDELDYQELYDMDLETRRDLLEGKL